MKDHTDYIELNRRFTRLDSSLRPEVSALGSYLSHAGGRTSDLGWSDLLAEKVVVILGEPGSGKTWELAHQCAVSRSRDEFSLFVELGALVSGDFLDALSPEDKPLFERWLAAGRMGRFFLDSVDEAKIRRQGDFHSGLSKIRNALGPTAINRARLVISSRISEWRPETDMQELLSIFPTLCATAKATARASSAPDPHRQRGPLVVQIDPLDRQRVGQFVSAKGQSDQDKFLAAIDDHFAWDFTGRPLDVLDLMSFWAHHGRLGSLTEIIENDVRLKLKETTQRLNFSVLAEGTAHMGAEALAAATVFCKRQQFKVPDDTFIGPDGLDAASCLPEDWRAEDINALLTRALFDSATYGHIRFHHRRVADYLAAQWLTRRMAEGCPIRSLEQLIFGNLHQRRVIRRSLAPVASWLCCGDGSWKQDLRAWILETCPEIHLEHGDPAALPTDYRRLLLRSIVSRNAGRGRVWLRSTPESLRRLADPALADDVSAFLTDQAISIDVRLTLIKLVRFGRLEKCLPSLLTLLSSASDRDHLGSGVMAAIRDIASDKSRADAWNILRGCSNIPADLCALACEALYPTTIGPREIAMLLSSVRKEVELPIDVPWSIERLLRDRLVIDHSGILLAELNRLVQPAPHLVLSHGSATVSERFGWLLRIIPTVLEKLLSKSVLTAPEEADAAESLAILAASFEVHDHTDLAGALDAATLRHPNVRRAYIWHCVERWRQEHGPTVPFIHSLFAFDSLLRASRQDLGWLTEDIEQQSERADKELALHLAIQLLDWPGGDRQAKRSLVKALRHDATLQALLRQAIRGQRVAWFRRLKCRLIDRVMWRHRYVILKSRIRSSRQQVTERWLLIRHRREIESGRAIRLIAALVASGQENAHRWASVNWADIAVRRGKRVARAVKAGCKRIWRGFTPQLPHQKAKPNETDDRVVLGLVGLQAMIDDSEFVFDSASDVDADLAARYAVNELNGLPHWLPILASAWPDAVLKVLDECISGEWTYATDRYPCYDVVARLCEDGGELARLAAPTIIGKLVQGDPTNTTVLRFALALALKVVAFRDATLMQISILRCRTLPVSCDAFALWSAACLQLDAREALDALDARLAPGSVADDAVTSICSMLNAGHGHSLPIVAEPSFMVPLAMRRLIPLVYRHVRVTDDIDRSGKGAYSPTSRDEAQEFRNSLLSRLAESEDPGAADALSGLLSEPLLSTHHDWIRHLLGDRAEHDADIVAWDARDIRTFALAYEADPKTDRELFSIILNRLSDIKHDVEKSDNSLREEVQTDSDEYVLRRWLARKLSERSRQRYTIPQEEEIDQKQRPDLRAEHPKSAPVSIEVKWAEKWTITDLVKGIEDQLVGQYLRARTSRFGVYVVAADGRQKKTWKCADGSSLDFSGVQALLESRARELTSARNEIDEVRIVSIDFRDPRTFNPNH